MLLPAGMKSRLPLTSTILMELVELIGPAFWNQEPIAISSTNRNILRGSPPIALPQGVNFEFGAGEPDELVQYCSLNDGVITGGDVGFRGYAKHVSGSDTYACRLTQLYDAPSNPDTILGSYIIRQVTQ